MQDMEAKACGSYDPFWLIRNSTRSVDLIWNEPVTSGARAPSPAGALRSTLNLKLPDAVTVSRFALIAGEDARAPSISLSLSAIPLFWQGPHYVSSLYNIALRQN